MSTKITPSLESITVRGKYVLPIVDFAVVERMLKQTECSKDYDWGIVSFGESIICLAGAKGKFDEFIKECRVGVPCYFVMTVIEHLRKSILVEVECHPVMWYRISKYEEMEYTENQVQEALIECASFVRRVMSVFKGKMVEPISVYPIIQRAEIKSRLSNLGLKEVISPLDKAERHIVQNNFIESLKSSRTAFEKMIDWQMKKRGLEKTDSYTHDLDRLKSKGYLDSETTKLIQTYYGCLSNIAVHERGEIEPGFYEAQMGYGMTLIMLRYFMDKLP